MSSVFSKVRRKIEYIHNKKATYDYAPQQGGWEKYGSPVFGDETTASVFDPFVVMIEDRYRLFVSERKNSGIICTDSTDGTEWEKWKVALEAGDKGSWEERVNRASAASGLSAEREHPSLHPLPQAAGSPSTPQSCL